jgi:hypothetical protein
VRRPSTPIAERVYLAFTPYHLLLCLAIQERDGHPTAALMYADEAGLFEEHAAARKMLESVFNLRLMPRMGSVPHWKRPLSWRLGGPKARRIYDDLGWPATAFICNGLRPESRAVQRRNPQIILDYVEDGMDAYSTSNSIHLSPWRRLLHLLVLGIPHPLAADLMTALPFRQGHVLIPALARKDLSGATNSIPAECLSWAVNALAVSIREPKGSERITDLYLMRHTERVGDIANYLEDVRKWTESIADSTRRRVAAVKAHPRESSERAVQVLSRLGVTVIPQNLPVELLVPTLSDSVAITCGLTTFVISSRLLLPGRRILLDDSVNELDVTLLRSWDPSISRESAVKGLPPSINP